MRIKYQPACECRPLRVRPELVDHSVHGEDGKVSEWDVELVVRCSHCGARYNEELRHERVGRQAQDLKRLREMIRGTDDDDDALPKI